MDEVEVVVAHSERATLRVGDVFVKLDGDPARLAREVAAMRLAPVPTAEVVWAHAPALALSRVAGVALGHLGEPSPASARAWEATGAVVRALHEAPLPPWSGHVVDELADRLETECAWLLAAEVLPVDVIERHRRQARRAMREWTPVFVHGDLQVDHVFVDGDRVTGIVDWSEGAPGDALFDLAVLTLGHPERLDEVVVGYGREVDRDVIRAWWSWRCLVAVRWLHEQGFGDFADMPEVAFLLADPGEP
ncbi:MAG: aminoglycoside phosphotransferase family protein [Acidimicrobiales bacterium]